MVKNLEEGECTLILVKLCDKRQSEIIAKANEKGKDTENRLPYLLDYNTHFPSQILEQNGGASYSLNIAYLAHAGAGTVELGFFFLFSSSKT